MTSKLTSDFDSRECDQLDALLRKARRDLDHAPTRAPASRECDQLDALLRKSRRDLDGSPPATHHLTSSHATRHGLTHAPASQLTTNQSASSPPAAPPVTHYFTAGVVFATWETHGSAHVGTKTTGTQTQAQAHDPASNAAGQLKNESGVKHDNGSQLQAKSRDAHKLANGRRRVEGMRRIPRVTNMQKFLDEYTNECAHGAPEGATSRRSTEGAVSDEATQGIASCQTTKGAAIRQATKVCLANEATKVNLANEDADAHLKAPSKRSHQLAEASESGADAHAESKRARTGFRSLGARFANVRGRKQKNTPTQKPRRGLLRRLRKLCEGRPSTARSPTQKGGSKTEKRFWRARAFRKSKKPAKPSFARASTATACAQETKVPENVAQSACFKIVKVSPRRVIDADDHNDENDGGEVNVASSLADVENAIENDDKRISSRSISSQVQQASTVSHPEVPVLELSSISGESASSGENVSSSSSLDVNAAVLILENDELRELSPLTPIRCKNPPLSAMKRGDRDLHTIWEDGSSGGPSKSDYDAAMKFLELEFLEHEHKSDVVAAGDEYQRINNISSMPIVRKADLVQHGLLEKGGCGEVYRVRHKDTGTDFALKVMRFDKGATRPRYQMEASAQREEEASAKVGGSPWVVSVHQVMRDGNTVQVLMEYCARGDLHDYLFVHRKKLLVNEKRQIAAEIVLMLEHIHSRRVVHRDLKPANILIDRTGHLKLADFDLAHTDMSYFATGAGERGGTHQYMTPEVYLGKAHDCTVDWWALGCIVYELFAGTGPFEFAGESRERMMERVQFGPVYDFGNFDRSPMAYDFVTELLRKNPASRLGCAGANEVKCHPWFRGFDWDALESGKMQGLPLFA